MNVTETARAACSLIPRVHCAYMKRRNSERFMSRIGAGKCRFFTPRLYPRGRYTSSLGLQRANQNLIALESGTRDNFEWHGALAMSSPHIRRERNAARADDQMTVTASGSRRLSASVITVIASRAFLCVSSDDEARQRGKIRFPTERFRRGRHVRARAYYPCVYIHKREDAYDARN